MHPANVNADYIDHFAQLRKHAPFFQEWLDNEEDCIARYLDSLSAKELRVLFLAQHRAYKRGNSEAFKKTLRLRFVKWASGQ